MSAVDQLASLFIPLFGVLVFVFLLFAASTWPNSPNYGKPGFANKIRDVFIGLFLLLGFLALAIGIGWLIFSGVLRPAFCETPGCRYD